MDMPLKYSPGKDAKNHNISMLLTVTLIMTLEQVPENMAVQVTSLIMAEGMLIAYIIGGGLTDTAAILYMYLIFFLQQITIETGGRHIRKQMMYMDTFAPN